MISKSDAVKVERGVKKWGKSGNDDDGEREGRKEWWSEGSERKRECGVVGAGNGARMGKEIVRKGTVVEGEGNGREGGEGEEKWSKGGEGGGGGDGERESDGRVMLDTEENGVRIE